MHDKDDSKNQGCSSTLGSAMVARFVPVPMGVAKISAAVSQRSAIALQPLAACRRWRYPRICDEKLAFFLYS